MKAPMITALANPKRFLDLSRALAPWICAVAILLLATGFAWSLFVTTPDYQQGQSVKIIFVHVPAAWMGIFVYGVMAAAALGGVRLWLLSARMSAQVSPHPAAPFCAASPTSGVP